MNRLGARLSARLSSYLNGEAAMPIVVLFLLNAVDELDTRTFEVLGPEIAHHFGVDVGVMGAITLGVILLAPLVSVPVAHLADRRRRMPLAVAGATAWGTFSLLTGFAPVLALLIAFRIGSGFGKVVNEPVHGGLIGEFYSPSTRAKAFGLHALANYAGVAFASLLAGGIAEIWGWRAAFFVLTVPTAAVLVIARRLPEPERGRFEVLEAVETPPLRETFRRLWAIRTLRLEFAGLAFAGGSVLGLGVLVPFFLEEDYGVEPFLRGAILAVGSVLSAIALIAGTAAVQRRTNERPSAGLRLICHAGLVITAGLVLAALSPWLWLSVFAIWLVTATIAFVTPGLLSLTAIVAPPHLRSSAFAVGGLMALAGSAFALIGFVVGSLISVRVAIAVMSPVFLRGIVLFYRAARFIDDDVARLDPSHVLAARATTEDGRAPVLLEVSGITASYSGVRVLFGVDLEVRRGEMIALLGTNGAGKSTTLNAISGILEPDGGNVFFDGDAITGWPPERTVALGLVQVPGGRGVFPGLTVEDNLKMGSFLLRRDRRAVAERMGEVLDLFPRLAERRSQLAGSLSGGERQMLTLGQSFLLRPRLLLIDELSLGLAPTVVAELLDAVRGMNAAGTSIVLVEQSVNVALTLADRAYFMEKGEVRFSGPTAELLARPDLLRSVFLEGAGSATR